MHKVFTQMDLPLTSKGKESEKFNKKLKPCKFDTNFHRIFQSLFFFFIYDSKSLGTHSLAHTLPQLAWTLHTQVSCGNVCAKDVYT